MTARPDPLRRAVTVTLIAAAIAGLWLTNGKPASHAPTPAETTSASDAPPTLASQDTGWEATDEPSHRVPAPPTIVEGEPAADFAARIEDLVQTGLATSRLAQNDEIEAAKASDARARARFEAILEHFADAGERALQLALDHAAPDGDEHDDATCRVLGMVLAAELARREQRSAAAGTRTAIDTLTANVLEVLPLGERLADCAGATLLDEPHLRAVHEPAVLHLVDLAGAQQFSRSLATRLLLTLWQNLQRFGERSSTDLACLALLQLDDADASRRTAACRHLLLSTRYRGAVLAWLREHQDLEVAAEVAAIAARELEPTAAIATLRELAPLLPGMPAAFMALGHRAPDALADAYEVLLADNVQPGVRRDLLAGLGMDDAGRQRRTLELALQNDPDPGVRLQALLSLSANAATQCGEAACERLLDDPAIAGDPARLSVIVLALQNLEVAGMTNAIDRLGQRLRAMRLPDEARRQLELVLARALPDGRTSAENGR